jgi:ApaG protein
MPCQLLRRKWIIVDGRGHKEIIEGDGVVGEQPHLNPGENYQYSSYCPLKTPSGSMRGSFFFADSNGEEFEVKVPLFFLRQDAIMQ